MDYGFLISIGIIVIAAIVVILGARYLIKRSGGRSHDHA